MVFVMLGLVADGSRAMYVATAVENAARAGAMFGFQSSTNQSNYAGMQAAATNSAPYITGISATATQYCEDSAGVSMSCAASPTRVYLDVSAQTNFDLLCSYIYLPTTIVIKSRNRMRIQ